MVHLLPDGINKNTRLGVVLVPSDERHGPMGVELPYYLGHDNSENWKPANIYVVAARAAVSSVSFSSTVSTENKKQQHPRYYR
jgi:hypothetical protein